MTAGSGLQHAEMFPLVHKEKENQLELFQVWLNLPSKDKFTEPFYKMLWAEDIPVIEVINKDGKKSAVRLIAGTYEENHSLPPSPSSCANDKKNHVGIRIIKMEPGAAVELPAVSNSLSRNLYYYVGDTISIQDITIEASHRVKLVGDEVITIVNGTKESSMLILEGEPILEPVVQYGPFVMTTEKEIQEAYRDYQRTKFGGWPWKRTDPTNEVGSNRFAHYGDGTKEVRGLQVEK